MFVVKPQGIYVARPAAGTRSPQTSASVHTPLGDSARLWREALDKINTSQETQRAIQRELLRAGAVLQAWGAAANFKIAADSFVPLLLADGLEALVSR
ncbi:MAG: hypothetical protein E3J64_09680 [Anaerolineales bacterium]|nr:MAG: hypothetical protein E3J64_09680 [Anaerolineales bacterium]